MVRDMTRVSIQDSEVEFLIPAAGLGERLGLGPKAFLELEGHSLLVWSAGAASRCSSRVLMGVLAGEEERSRREVHGLAEVVTGGDSRHATILRLFEASRAPYLVIHDAARPFASESLFRRVIAALEKGPAVACGTKLSLPMGTVVDGRLEAMADRNSHQVLQTPLGFRREALAEALEHARARSVTHLTPIELAVSCGTEVTVVPDEPTNVKITTPLEWELAQKILAPRLSSGR